MPTSRGLVVLFCFGFFLTNFNVIIKVSNLKNNTLNNYTSENNIHSLSGRRRMLTISYLEEQKKLLASACILHISVNLHYASIS